MRSHETVHTQDRDRASAEAAHMTGHSLDVWVRHHVGRDGPAQRADARARLLEGGFGAIDDADE